MRKLLFSELSDIIAIYVDVPLHNKMSSKTRTAFFGFRQALCFAAILESKKKNSREIISKIFFLLSENAVKCICFLHLVLNEYWFFFSVRSSFGFFLEWSQIQETFCLKVQ